MTSNLLGAHTTTPVRNGVADFPSSCDNKSSKNQEFLEKVKHMLPASPKYMNSKNR